MGGVHTAGGLDAHWAVVCPQDWELINCTEHFRSLRSCASGSSFPDCVLVLIAGAEELSW